jgi:hypothetical protein
VCQLVEAISVSLHAFNIFEEAMTDPLTGKLDGIHPFSLAPWFKVTIF